MKEITVCSQLSVLNHMVGLHLNNFLKSNVNSDFWEDFSLKKIHLLYGIKYLWGTQFELTDLQLIILCAYYGIQLQVKTIYNTSYDLKFNTFLRKLGWRIRAWQVTITLKENCLISKSYVVHLNVWPVFSCGKMKE